MRRIGIDVGGTFTDLVAVDHRGAVLHTKIASTPRDPSEGVMAGLAGLAGLVGVNLAALLAGTERIVHGTTVATNVLLERKGARVGLLTTEGHRDVLEMREGLKDDRYNLRVPPPVPLVPRHLRLGVRERMRADGRVETPLDPASLEAAIAALRAAEVEAVAICYLHAYREPAHERATADAVARALPDAYVTLSSDVLRQIKEYERVYTTVVNAYVGPALSRYLRRLEARLAEAGYAGPTLIIQSHGGVAPVADAARLAAGAVLSGPAGGVAGSRHVAALLGVPDLIPFDMGGTSVDISLITDGEPALVGRRGVGGHLVALSSLDIVSLGAGGGSLAHVDKGGILHVGPASAGAWPGPACYGQGGEGATVTDANLVLGYLDPEHFLGGQMRLDHDAAGRAVDRVAEALGTDRVATALGIHRVANLNLAEGIRLVSVRRGVDPRRYALLSFGGAAGLHVADVARQLGIGRVIVPRLAAVLSAWGMLATDLRFEVTRTHLGETGALDGDAVALVFAEMEDEGRARLAACFEGEVAVRRSAEMRYGEQVFEIEVPLDDVDWTGDVTAQLASRFHARHEALYTYALRDQAPVLVNAKVAAIGRLPSLPLEAASAPPGLARPPRRVFLRAWRTVPVHDFDALPPGWTEEGPAIVESSTTTVLLGDGDRAALTGAGWLDVSVAQNR